MKDLQHFDPDGVGNPNNNIFGLPTNEEEAQLIVLSVPWEVTVSYAAGTSRAPDAIMKASLQVDLYDSEYPDLWRKGYYLRLPDTKLLMKSDYLRREAELYIDYISTGEDVNANNFMCKTLKEVNEGGAYMTNWVYENIIDLLKKNKWVAALGGDHSTSLGTLKAMGETFGNFGILQIDAHCDLRVAYEGFIYSHASVMYNALNEIPQITKLVQVGIRDFGCNEHNFILENKNRIDVFLDKDIKYKQYCGENWSNIAQEIISKLPDQVFISFDIDGLDRKLCPQTGTPVPGGFEINEMYYLFNMLLKSGKKIIGFDLNEVGVHEGDWNANVGARLLFKLCNVLAASKLS